MPTYQYACTACDHRLEVVQSFSDASLTECPACTGGLRKVFSSVGIVFKGSGFYRTDSRAGAGSTMSNGEGKAGGAKSDGGKADGAKSDGAKSDGARSDAPRNGSKSSGGSTSGASTSSSSSPAPAAARS